MPELTYECMHGGNRKLQAEEVQEFDEIEAEIQATQRYICTLWEYKLSRIESMLTYHSTGTPGKLKMSRIAIRAAGLCERASSLLVATGNPEKMSAVIWWKPKDSE